MEKEKVICNKVRFNKREAQSALNILKDSNKPWRRESRYYHCPICNNWHLTSKGRGEGKIQEIKLINEDQWLKLLSKDTENL
jgi:hypothetical protein